MHFTESEIDQWYNLSIKFETNSINQEELITKISNFRGGSFIDVVAALGLIGTRIISTMNEGLAFQPNSNLIISPHLQWLYGN